LIFEAVSEMKIKSLITMTQSDVSAETFDWKMNLCSGIVELTIDKIFQRSHTLDKDNSLDTTNIRSVDDVAGFEAVAVIESNAIQPGVNIINLFFFLTDV
jgi:hypothetical protein